MSEQSKAELINESVNKWNAWFEDKFESDSYLDLSNSRIVDKDLQGIMLSGVSLKGADLTSSNMTSVYLGNTLLEGATLEKSILSSSNFCSGKLVKVNFVSAKAKLVNFCGVELCEVNFRNANLTQSKFNGTQIKNGYFSSAVMRETEFNSSKLVECDYYKADIEGSEFNGASIKSCAFSNANLENSKLNGSFITECDFSSANLKNAEFTSANLKRLKLVDADLSGSNLREAKLNHIDFKGVNLENADLTNTELEHADLRFAKNYLLNSTYIRNTRFPVTACDPWSKLRKAYTGPAMLLTLLALASATMPYILKALYWSAVNAYQANTGVISLTCESYQCYGIYELLLGFDKDWYHQVIIFVLLFYNIFRGGLTYMVSLMRAEEERSGYSPQWMGAYFWQGYKPLFQAHKVLKIIQIIALIVFFYNLFYWATRLVFISN
ncbi:pentapeptide repeat-containing protein [Leucothrix sargassi]|nr:pentapeptide repeat-containing protein [Leucothrix sargassi]